MSCYFRHLKEIFQEIGIEVTAENRKKVDQAFHQVLGVEYKNCMAVWKKLKLELAGDEKKRRELAAKLRQAIG